MNVVTNLNCTGIGWNYERFVGMAFSLAHWMEPVKTTWIQVDPGMTDRNGTVVAAGDEVTFYVHGTDTVIGTKKAGEKFYFPESDGRYYFDLYAAEQYAKNNYTGPEMVAQNSCATFASEILINAGMGMYAAYADNARDGQNPRINPSYTTIDVPARGIFEHFAALVGDNYVTYTNIGVTSSAFRDNCTATVALNADIQSGDFIRLGGGHVMYVAHAYKEGDKKVLKLYAQSTAFKDTTDARITAVIHTSRLAVDFEVVHQNGSLELTKKSADDSNKLLANAKFKLTGVSVLYGPVEKTTGSDGKITWTDLPAGTYKVEETSAPSGYDITFTATNVTVTAGQTAYVTATDKAYAYIKVLKVDSEHGNKPLQGAKFTVTNSSGTTVATLTTGADGTATTGKLPYGTYKIKETQAPTGYYITGSDTATVTLSHSTVNPGATLTHTRDNTLITGDVTVYKFREKLYTGAADVPLSGAKLRLCLTGTTTAAKDANGNVLPDKTTLPSGAIPSAWTNVPYGTYDIVELEAPEGYQNAGVLMTFSITTPGQNVSYRKDTVNTPIYGSEVRAS